MSKRYENRSGYKETKVGWIPEDWNAVTLDDIGEFSKGAGIIKDDLLSEGLPAIRYGEIYTNHNFIVRQFYSFISSEVAETSKKIFFGDILFAGSGETHEEIGKCVAYINKEVAYAGGDIVILSLSIGDPEFLGYLLNQEIVNCQKSKLGQGNSIVHIYGRFLKDIVIPFPPLPEQRKIGEILSIWDKTIELVGKQIEAKQRLKKGLMQQLLTGKKRFPGFGKPASGDELPGGWQEERLGKLADIGTGSRDLKDNVLNGKYPFFVRSEIIKRIDSYSYDGEAILMPGEGKIGEVFHYINGKFDYHQRVYKISDFSLLTIGKYIYYYLSQFFIREAARNSVKATVDSLRLPTFLNMRVRLPVIAEQRKIVNTLELIDCQLDNLDKKIDVLTIQKQGMMQKLLTGEVRV